MGFFDSDLAYPTVKAERSKHKKMRLVQGPNAYFMDVKCPKCLSICTVYSHATTNVTCSGCKDLLTKKTGGKVTLVQGASFRKKAE